MNRISDVKVLHYSNVEIHKIRSIKANLDMEAEAQFVAYLSDALGYILQSKKIKVFWDNKSYIMKEKRKEFFESSGGDVLVNKNMVLGYCL